MFNSLFYKPIANLMVYFYNTIAFQDLGVAIILATVVVRLILYPFFHKMFHQQALNAKIKPALQKIQIEFKDDKVKQAQETMDLYKKYNVNPLYPLFFMMVQLPIVIALYRVFTIGIKENLEGSLYSFVKYPGVIDTISFKFFNLAERNILLIIMAGLLQYIQAKISSQSISNDPEQKKMNEIMAVVGTVIMIVVLWQTPSAVAFYFMIMSLFSIYQQRLCNNQIEKNEELK